jgi:nucleotide-binding universal stress UspA family protein
MITKILLGYDASGSARNGFTFAMELAQHYQAELHVVAVVQPPDFAHTVESEALIENSLRFHQDLLHPLVARMTEAKIAGQCAVLVGHPAEQLLSYAARHAVDHIVVGHRGQSMFERWLLGSVARRVIVHAHCAVTVVRQQADRAGETTHDASLPPAHP